MKSKNRHASWMNDEAKLRAAVEKRRITYKRNHPKKPHLDAGKPSLPIKKRKYTRSNKINHHNDLYVMGAKLHDLDENGTRELVEMVPVFLDIIWNDFTPLEKAQAIKVGMANRGH